MSCPTCHGSVAQKNNPYRPFCSSRCKSVDLMRWLDGSYRLPGEPVDPEQLPAMSEPPASRGQQ